MLLFTHTAALAAPPGWKVTREDIEGCELSLGPAESDGIVPMRAECLWPDVTLARFNEKLAVWSDYDDFLGVIVESEVRRPGERALVFQKHTTKGISDRELVQWMWHEVVDGYDRYAWTRATEEPFTPADGNVATLRSDGFWQAKAEGDGVHVVHQLSYDPGGSVPGMLVRMFQTSGLQATATEMHAALKSP